MKPIINGKYKELDEKIEFIIKEFGSMTVWDIWDVLKSRYDPFRSVNTSYGVVGMSIQRDQLALLNRRLSTLKRLSRINGTNRYGFLQWTLANDAYCDKVEGDEP